jgi:hypothetical protein
MIFIPNKVPEINYPIRDFRAQLKESISRVRYQPTHDDSGANFDGTIAFWP